MISQNESGAAGAHRSLAARGISQKVAAIGDDPVIGTAGTRYFEPRRRSFCDLAGGRRRRFTDCALREIAKHGSDRLLISHRHRRDHRSELVPDHVRAQPNRVFFEDAPLTLSSHSRFTPCTSRAISWCLSFRTGLISSSERSHEQADRRRRNAAGPRAAKMHRCQPCGEPMGERARRDSNETGAMIWALAKIKIGRGQYQIGYWPVSALSHAP
jgi:hypothetical protein